VLLTTVVEVNKILLCDFASIYKHFFKFPSFGKLEKFSL